VIASSVEWIAREVDDDALVLDVGGWAKPFRRADVVLDQMPYESRGLYGFDGEGTERFDEASWICRDICDRTPWPFADGTFDFAVCSHTLEDVRDPVWVCAELVRVAKAGYIEVPSRLEEQCYGIQGPWVGWGHHHWLADVAPGSIEFVFKHHVMHGMPAAHFPPDFYGTLRDDERVQSLWWEGSFTASERTFVDAEGLDTFLASFVSQELRRRGLARSLRRAAASSDAASARGGTGGSVATDGAVTDGALLEEAGPARAGQGGATITRLPLRRAARRARRASAALSARAHRVRQGGEHRHP